MIERDDERWPLGEEAGPVALQVLDGGDQAFPVVGIGRRLDAGNLLSSAGKVLDVAAAALAPQAEGKQAVVQGPRRQDQPHGGKAPAEKTHGLPRIVKQREAGGPAAVRSL